jgi:hypothetical protein
MGSAYGSDYIEDAVKGDAQDTVLAMLFLACTA